MAIRTLYGWLGHGVAVMMTAVALVAWPAGAVVAAGDEDRLVTRGAADEAAAVAGVYLLLVNGNNRYTAGDAAMMVQVRHLYLGRQDAWPDSRAAVPLGRPADGAAQGALRRLILGMSREALEAHWLRRNAATGAAPPRVVAETRELVRAIARGEGAFGVVAADEAARLPAGVRVLFRFSLREVAGAISTERLFWQSIETSADPAGFQAYLGAFPGGAYAALARARIDALTGAPAARLEAREDAAVVASLPDASGAIDADALKDDEALKQAITGYFNEKRLRMSDALGEFWRIGESEVIVVDDLEITEILSIAGNIMVATVKYHWQSKGGKGHAPGKTGVATVRVDTSGPSYRILDFQSEEFPHLAASSVEQPTVEAGVLASGENLARDDALKHAIIAFFNARPNKFLFRVWRGPWPAVYDARMTSIETIEVLDRSEGLVRLAVEYRWDSGAQLVSRPGRGIATVAGAGASYEVVDFQIR